MNEQSPPSIEPLGSRHDRAAFSCGEPALDAYLHRQAGQDMRRGVSRVFVATFEDPAEIAGFYTLSACTVEARNLPKELARKLPKHPLPAALIGRLAVGLRYQAQGLGKCLLMDALMRAMSASVSIGIFAVVVDAKNDKAVSFYEKYGFEAFPDVSKRLFIPLRTALPRDDTKG